MWLGEAVTLGGQQRRPCLSLEEGCPVSGYDAQAVGASRSQQHQEAPGFSVLLAAALSGPASRQECGSECEAWTHSLLLGDLGVEQAKIKQPP